MEEQRYPKRLGRRQERLGLRTVQVPLAERRVDQRAVQPEIAGQPFQLTGGIVAAERIDAAEAEEPAGVPTDQMGTSNLRGAVPVGDTT
jgi:hypothetical protein